MCSYKKIVIRLASIILYQHYPFYKIKYEDYIIAIYKCRVYKKEIYSLFF